MRGTRRLILVASGLLTISLVGCASSHSKSKSRHAAAATQPLSPNALLTLDQIEPKPVLATTTQPTTAPATLPPLDAILMYAESRDALQRGKRQESLDLLEKAVQLDPQSFELRYALGTAYQNGVWDERSLATLLSAADIDPNHADLQSDIGRQLLAKGDWSGGVEHLRLAMQASDYATDDATAGIVELFLANALSQKGYDTAALQLLEHLRNRLKTPTLAVRVSPELFYLVSRPELVAMQIGEVHERLGNATRALAEYEPIAAADPADFDLQMRVVRTLARAGRLDDAKRKPGELVVQTHAKPDAISLLRDVYRTAGREGEAAEALQRLHDQTPDDRVLLYALADFLRADGRVANAIHVLEKAAAEDPADFEIVRRLVTISRDKSPDGTAAAARLIRWSADHPDSIHRMNDLWDELLQPRGGKRLRVAALEAIDLRSAGGPRLQAAREFWISRVAQNSYARTLAKDSLDRAVNVEGKPFAPAYRAKMDRIWSQPAKDDAARIEEADALSKRAESQGDASLAAELRGLSLLSQKKPADAEAAFDQAEALGGKSPDLLFIHALSRRAAGDTPGFEQALWKLASDWPEYDDSFKTLYAYYESTRAFARGEKVLTTWLIADPQNVYARLLQVRAAYARGRTQAAEKLLVDLFEDAPADAQVMASLYSYYSQAGQVDELVKKVEARHQAEPASVAITTRLVSLEIERGHPTEALKAIDATRKAAAHDADLLYETSHLYLELDQKDASEATLREALKLEPHHAAAANDLGYALADQGKNLDESERLARLAVAAEPDSGAYLDSLGWVLYKRGKFSEARGHLERALAVLARPDPIMLDHLGDVLYRDDKAAEATERWNQAAEILKGLQNAESRADLKALKAQLDTKQKQAAAGEPVAVAPIATEVK